MCPLGNGNGPYSSADEVIGHNIQKRPECCIFRFAHNVQNVVSLLQGYYTGIELGRGTTPKAGAILFDELGVTFVAGGLG